MKTKSKLFIIGAMCFGAFLFGTIASTMLNAQNESPVAAPAFTPPTFSFQKNLKLGDDNQDVRQLQIVLNSDAGTRVSDAGIGSKGQESTYFGQLTANAVMRFQLKNGISGTSFVGVLTRAKLNQLVTTMVAPPTSLATATATATSAPLFSGPMPLAKERLPRLYTARPMQISQGGTFTLVGAGFQTENTVHIGSYTFSRVFPQDSNNISFTISGASSVPNGTYEIWVENSKGSSKVPGQPINLTVVDSLQPASVISSVTPATVSGTETVIVSGSGFAPSGNDIFSGFGTIKNLPSNGSQITFSPRSLLTAEVIARIPVGTTIKVDFYVVNATGPSNVFGSVNLKL